MKKWFGVFLAICILFVSTTVYAANLPSISILVKGNVEVGQDIQILINIENIESFYAGAASFKYDPTVLKVKSIQKGDLISKTEIKTFDVANKIDEANGIAKFGGFTCLGKVEGFSGTGTFITINAQVLKKQSFHVKSVPLISIPTDENNLKIQLCDKNIKELSYNFSGYEFKVDSSGQSQSSQPNSSNQSNTGNQPVNSSETKKNSILNKIVSFFSTIKNQDETKITPEQTNASKTSDKMETKTDAKTNKSHLMASAIILAIIVAGGTTYYFRKKRKNNK